MNKCCLAILSIFLVTVGCKKEAHGPKIDDYFLNYDIPEVPVTADYEVGAFYYTWGTFNPGITEVPTLGQYKAPAGLLDAGIMSKQIELAKQGGIDYFLFQARSWNKENGGFKEDSAIVHQFIEANTDGKLRFALNFKFNPGAYGVNTNTPLENDGTKLSQFFDDLDRWSAVLGDANYEKVDGKILLYMTNSNQLFSTDNKALFKEIRKRMADKGFDLYIVGYQERWSPPARYLFRFEGCVDAVYEQSYSSQPNNWDRQYLLGQLMDQNWKYSKKYFADNAGIDFIPNITPAYSWTINQPNSTNPEYPRTDKGALYQTLCNVAKMNASEKTRLILIDSWNNWAEDMQLEPAESYGNLYLDITKKEFKK